MRWSALARLLFVVGVSYCAYMLRPLGGGAPINVTFSLILAGLIRNQRAVPLNGEFICSMLLIRGTFAEIEIDLAINAFQGLFLIEVP